MLFKICGLKKIETLKCCISNKVNFFGMIFYKKSPRYIELENAIKLVHYSRNKKIVPVGVFVDEKISDLNLIIDNLNLEVIQLHGNENNEYIKELKLNKKVQVIKSVSIKNKENLKNVNNYSFNDYFLLDYKPEIGEMPGGNAKSFDWSILSNLKIDKPWFLSGGINLKNINKIKDYSNPDGIDLSSGVEEAPGIKNLTMIDNLFEKYYDK